MAKERSETYHNLLDFSLQMDDVPEIAGRGDELFYAVMRDYFFKEEAVEKAVQGILNGLQVPDFFRKVSTLRQISPDDIEKMVLSSTINDTFAGKIILSKKYLKTFFPHHQPDYQKMPTDVQMEIIDRIKMKNEDILYAFTKMRQDMESDRKRSLLKLLAMALKNVHLKTGFPLKPVPGTVEALIRQEYPNCDSLFTADPRIMTDLMDDKKIKALVKNIFKVKKHNDIVDMATRVKSEIRRFESRIQRTLQS